ncbi:unnamed protein product [Heligmosomoides polygyrus]|uniref:Uncharacterized protein n=1 Tax=Heligmosomoides polygyrus TaxID=6339 RepID=A0A183GHB7_HELPZ|nr:unnamed protein product [Heligmosomoides polygyrus]
MEGLVGLGGKSEPGTWYGVQATAGGSSDCAPRALPYGLTINTKKIKAFTTDYSPRTLYLDNIQIEQVEVVPYASRRGRWCIGQSEEQGPVEARSAAKDLRIEDDRARGHRQDQTRLDSGQGQSAWIEETVVSSAETSGKSLLPTPKPTEQGRELVFHYRREYGLRQGRDQQRGPTSQDSEDGAEYNKIKADDKDTSTKDK